MVDGSRWQLIIMSAFVLLIVPFFKEFTHCFVNNSWCASVMKPIYKILKNTNNNKTTKHKKQSQRYHSIFKGVPTTQGDIMNKRRFTRVITLTLLTKQVTANATLLVGIHSLMPFKNA